MKVRHVDEFMQPEHRRAFETRQAKVQSVTKKLSLAPGNAIIVGGAGLALHGLDTRLPDSRHPFDVDAFLSVDKVAELRNRCRLLLHVVDTEEGTIKIPRPIVAAPFSGHVEAFTGNAHTGFETSAQSMEVVRGVPAQSAGALAAMKVESGRVKDVGGIIKAHVIAHYEELPVAQDPSWQAEVVNAIHRVRQNDLNRVFTSINRPESILPEWLGQLKNAQFEHEAFATLTLNNSQPAQQ